MRESLSEKASLRRKHLSQNWKEGRAKTVQVFGRRACPGRGSHVNTGLEVQMFLSVLTNGKAIVVI